MFIEEYNKMIFTDERFSVKLLNKIQKSFEMKINSSPEIKRLMKILDEGSPSYQEAQDCAIELAKLLSDSFKLHLSQEILPDGKMDREIAETILRKTLGDNFKLVSNYTTKVQEKLNKSVGVEIKGIPSEINKDRIDGLINILSDDSDFNDVKWAIDEPTLTNYSLDVVTRTVIKNADFHSRLGLEPKVVRSSKGKCCEWCDKLVGTYDYETIKDTGNDVWRRHKNCKCLVEYVPVRGPRRNAHTHKNSGWW